MFKRENIKSYGGWLFIFLCIILIMGHSGGMITLYVLFCLYFMTCIKQIDSTSILLLFFSISYVFISLINGAITTLNGALIYGLPWFVFYHYGKYVMARAKNEKSIIDFLILICLFVGLPIYLSMALKISQTGEIVDVSRSYYMFGNEEDRSTGNGACLEVFMGYVGLPAFFLLKQLKLERWIYLVLFFFSILVAINLVSRFPLVVSVFCFVIIMFLKYRKKPMIMVAVLLFVSVLFFVLYYQGGVIGQIFEAYSDRNEDISNLSTFGDRSNRWEDAVSQLVAHPFGWHGGYSQYNYVHNMWLDIAKYSGVIPFILLVVATIKSFVVNIRIIFKRSSSLAFILLALNISFVLSAFVQPVYGGINASLYCMIMGIQNKYFERIRNNSIFFL